MHVLQSVVSELYRTQKEVTAQDVVERIYQVAEELELPPLDEIFQSNTKGWGVRFRGLHDPVWLAAA